MKKAGIVIGIVFVVTAILVLVIGNKVITKGSENPESPENQEVVETVDTEKQDENKEEVKDEKKENGEAEDVTNTEKPVVEQQIVTKVETQIVDKDNTSVKTINASSLGNPSEEKEVITTISNKRILLVDEKVDGKDRKMLTYVFDVMVPPENNTMLVFVTKKVYDSFNVNDKLKVNYVVYKNDVGVDFPLVSQVSSVN